jgi:hypothetical protein
MRMTIAASPPSLPLGKQRQRLAKLAPRISPQCDGADPHLSTTHIESAQTAMVTTGQKRTRTFQFKRWYSLSADFKMMRRLEGVPSVLLARSMARS